MSSRSSGTRVEALTFAPPGDLADTVEAFWVGRWDLTAEPAHQTELLGDPCVHVVFEAGPRGLESRLVGVWTRRWVRTLDGRGLVRAAKLKAGAVRAYFSQDAHDFTDRITPLGEACGAPLHDLAAAILHPVDDQAGLLHLADWLRAIRRPSPQTGWAIVAVQRIIEDPDIMSVDALCQRLGCQRRQLQREFRSHVGASPKWVLRRHRLQEAALRLEQGDIENLAALAADLGYADQAHFCRDFRTAVGRSPSAFARAVWQ